MSDQHLSDKELDELLERIQKLMRLRDNDGATVGEVANATTMIQNLLTKYNVSMAEVESHSPERKANNDFIKNSFSVGASSNYRQEWRVRLCNVIAINNWCRLTYHSARKGNRSLGLKGTEANVILIGRPYNVQIVQEMYEWVALQLNRLCTKAWTQYAREGGMSSKKTYKTSFFLGAISEVHARLAEEKRRQQEADGAVNALIVLNDQGLQEAYERFFGKSVRFDIHAFVPGPYGKTKICQHTISEGCIGAGTRCSLGPTAGTHFRATTSRMPRVDSDGYAAGAAAGQNVSLTPTKKVAGRRSRKQIGG